MHRNSYGIIFAVYSLWEQDIFILTLKNRIARLEQDSKVGGILTQQAFASQKMKTVVDSNRVGHRGEGDVSFAGERFRTR